MQSVQAEQRARVDAAWEGVITLPIVVPSSSNPESDDVAENTFSAAGIRRYRESLGEADSDAEEVHSGGADEDEDDAENQRIFVNALKYALGRVYDMAVKPGRKLKVRGPFFVFVAGFSC